MLALSAVEVPGPIGTKLLLDWRRDWGWEEMYLKGLFEAATSATLAALLRDSDIVIDVGANVGWYTVLMARAVPNGHCYAFEPEPGTFSWLKRNCRLNGLGANLTLEALALGELEKSIELYTFDALPRGHTSRSPLGRTDSTSCSVPMTTVDAYVRRRPIGGVDLVKVDVEGAELTVLDGANDMLRDGSPPIWVFEMNDETARHFGYKPADLLRRLAQHDDYEFYRMGVGEIERIASPTDYRHGENVLCVPPRYRSRLEGLRRGDLAGAGRTTERRRC